jgi:hypothetical protein
MMGRLVTAALHRFGVVRQLQAQWRGDIEAAGTRAAARAAKAGEQALEPQLRAIEAAHAQSSARLTEAVEVIERLAAQTAALATVCARLERRAAGLEQVIVRNRREAGRLRDFRRLAASGAIARHVAAAIARAPLVEDPAPMLVVDGIFPDDVYEILLAAIPPAEAFTPKDRTKADYRAHRPQVPVPDLADAVWPYLDTELIPHAMVPAIAGRMAPFVAAHCGAVFGPEVGAQVATLSLEATSARLMLRRPGYHLDPHFDPKRVVLTTLLYFARPGDDEAHGTAFYRVDGRVARDHATTFYPQQAGHRCELARVVPFRPNTALVFLNSAAHGADLPADAPPDLERYALQFYVGPPVAELTAILRRLPDPQRATWAALLE